jgi:hypothetical protein
MEMLTTLLAPAAALLALLLPGSGGRRAA